MPKQAALLKGAEPGCEIDIVMSARAEMTMDVSDQPDPDLEARVAAALAARRACEEHETVSSAVFFFLFFALFAYVFPGRARPSCGCAGREGTRDESERSTAFSSLAFSRPCLPQLLYSLA